MLLANATLADGRRADVDIDGARIAAVRMSDVHPNFSPADTERTIDLSGYVLLPAFVNGHAHLDKTLWGGPRRPHRATGTVPERIAAERDLLIEFESTLSDRARALATTMIAHGTGTVRTHADIDPIVGLSRFEALRALRDDLAAALRMQVVAFPQSGVTEAETLRLLDRAVRRGADAVGLVDPLDMHDDPEQAIDAVFEIARRHDVGVDIHLHSRGERAAREYGLIIDRTRRGGRGGRVAIAHAPGLADLGCADLARVADGLAAAEISVMTSAQAAPLPPIRALRSAGVNVFAGTDNVRDFWHPFGDGDMLGIARHLAGAAGLRTDGELSVALEAITEAAARALGLEPDAVRAGGRADLVAVRAESAVAAVSAPPPDRLTIHAGRVVATSRLDITLSVPERVASAAVSV